jgi:multiple sugar transport system permease protein
MRSPRLAWRLLLYLVLTVGAVVCLIPIYWLVRSSLMTLVEIFKYPPLAWPSRMRWDNYANAMTAVPFLLYFRNTLIIVIPTVLATLVTSSMSAYGLARFRFPLRGFWFSLVVGAIIVPPAVVLIPQFILWTRLHLVNTFYPLIIPYWFGGGAFNVFLLRQFFMTIPRDFDDAARMDGATYMRIFRQILLPFIQPALIAVGLFQFFFQWNDFFSPLIYLNDPNTYTLALGLTHFIGTFATQWSYLMAATVIIVLPPVIIFFIGQRYFVEGITLTGIKM